MNLSVYNSPEYQKKMQECIDQYEIIDKLRAEVERLRATIAALDAAFGRISRAATEIITTCNLPTVPVERSEDKA